VRPELYLASQLIGARFGAELLNFRILVFAILSKE
jgi:hypothetical protein